MGIFLANGFQKVSLERVAFDQRPEQWRLSFGSLEATSTPADGVFGAAP